MRIGILLAGTVTIFAGMMALGNPSSASPDASHAPADYTKISPRLGKKHAQGKVGESLQGFSRGNCRAGR